MRVALALALAQLISIGAFVLPETAEVGFSSRTEDSPDRFRAFFLAVVYKLLRSSNSLFLFPPPLDPVLRLRPELSMASSLTSTPTTPNLPKERRDGLPQSRDRNKRKAAEPCQHIGIRLDRSAAKYMRRGDLENYESSKNDPPPHRPRQDPRLQSRSARKLPRPKARHSKVSARRRKQH